MPRCRRRIGIQLPIIMGVVIASVVVVVVGIHDESHGQTLLHLPVHVSLQIWKTQHDGAQTDLVIQYIINALLAAQSGTKSEDVVEGKGHDHRRDEHEWNQKQLCREVVDGNIAIPNGLYRIYII